MEKGIIKKHRSHSFQRLLERYGLKLNQKLRNKIEYIILTKKAIFVRDSSPHEIWNIRISKHRKIYELFVVYNRPHNMIITFL